MIRRPPRSTRTDTLFPYTTLFRSQRRARQFNLDNINSGSPVRAQVKSGNWDFFRPGSPGEKRRCDGQGGVIAPWFSEAKKQWIYPDGSAECNPGSHARVDQCRSSEEHTSELQTLMRTSYAVF